MFNFCQFSKGFSLSSISSRSLSFTVFNAAKVSPHNLKGKPKSSQEWLIRHLNDPYAKFARFKGYRCRSASKLLEIDDKYKILRPGQAVVDCGAAPGSWTQVVVERLGLLEPDQSTKKGVAIAIDLKDITPITGAITLKLMDFTKMKSQSEILSHLPNGEADVVLSDMAPNATGVRDIDCIQISGLVYSSFNFCTKVLKPEGTFLCKMWASDHVQILMNNLNQLFSSVKIVKPKACYDDSSELFILSMGFKGVSKPV